MSIKVDPSVASSLPSDVTFGIMEFQVDAPMKSNLKTGLAFSAVHVAIGAIRQIPCNANYSIRTSESGSRSLLHQCDDRLRTIQIDPA